MPDRIDQLIESEALPASYRDVVTDYWAPLADEIAEFAARAGHPPVIGINGAQGSGKSTLCRFLEALLEVRSVKAVTLSIDDLYLGRDDRLRLGREKHPLFVTRGVPGTHDVALGIRILDDLKAGGASSAPRFEKAHDDRSRQGVILGPADLVLFEGWCVDAVAEPAARLDQPVNSLEADEDGGARWRGEVNFRLASDYANLFARIDALIMLKISDFAAVRRNRLLQEEKLARTNPQGAAIMDEAAIERFLAHYERLTRWMLTEMPGRADILFEIGEDHRPHDRRGAFPSNT